MRAEGLPDGPARVTGRVGVVAMGLITLAVSVAACEWFDTMSRPVSIQPHEREPRPAPQGSVPIGGLPEFDLLTADAALTPPPQIDRSLEVGRRYYDDFCAVCHGASGLGNGPVSTKFPAIPAIVTPQVIGYSDAYLFALITQGRGLMPEYSRIPQPARWEVARYVRSLAAGSASGEVPTGAAPDTGAAKAPDGAAGGQP